MDRYTILIEMHPVVAHNIVHFRILPLFRARQNEISMEDGNLSEVILREFRRAYLQREERVQEGIIILKEL